MPRGEAALGSGRSAGPPWPPLEAERSGARLLKNYEGSPRNHLGGPRNYIGFPRIYMGFPRISLDILGSPGISWDLAFMH